MKSSQDIKIILIHPDTPMLAEPLSFPGLEMLYISSYIKKSGYTCDYYDLTGGVRLPEDLQGNIFGFTAHSVHFHFCVNTMKKLRKQNPNAIFVIGGPFPTWSSDVCIEAGFDIVVRGEGELAMADIIRNYQNLVIEKKNSNSLKKVVIQDGFVDINSIIPDWEAIDATRYKYKLEGRKCISMMTSRGNCPFGAGGKCRFCSKTQFGPKRPLRFREVDHVLKEAEYLRETYNFASLMLYDDEMLVNKKRDMKIFRGLHDLDIKFRCMTRADLADKHDLEKLKKYGCAELAVGIESGDKYILEKVINKGITVEKNTQFVKDCHDVGLRVKAYLIIGLPGESRESVENTKKWLREANTDNYDLSIFAPYAGSEIYENSEDYEIFWDDNSLEKIWYTGEAQYGDPGVWTPYLSAEQIRGLRGEIYSEFPRSEGGTTSYWGPDSA